MKRTRNPEDKIERILAAAAKILQDGGHYTQFSLANVAAEAQISKGGLLHHFPNKESLLRGLAENILIQFEKRLTDFLAQEPAGKPGRFSRAYIAAAFSDEHSVYDPISPVLLSFVRYSAEGEPLISRFDAFRDRLENDGLDPIVATTIRMAVDGVLYTEIIDAEPIDADIRKKLISHLIELTCTEN